LACAADSAAQICRKIFFERDHGNRCPLTRARAISSWRSWPLRSSIAKNTRPSGVAPKSLMSITFSWRIRDAAFASCMKRSTRSDLRANSPCRIFRATCFSSRLCVARYTAPMPPSPSLRSIT
jgi:hypothetical protein